MAYLNFEFWATQVSSGHKKTDRSYKKNANHEISTIRLYCLNKVFISCIPCRIIGLWFCLQTVNANNETHQKEPQTICQDPSPEQPLQIRYPTSLPSKNQ